MSYQMAFDYSFGGYPTDEAIASLVGQTPTVNGCPGKVLEAVRVRDRTVRIRVEVEGEPPPIPDVGGFSIDRFGERL